MATESQSDHKEDSLNLNNTDVEQQQQNVNDGIISFSRHNARNKYFTVIGVALTIVVVTLLACELGHFSDNSMVMQISNRNFPRSERMLIATDPQQVPIYALDCPIGCKINVNEECELSVGKMDALQQNLWTPDHLTPYGSDGDPVLQEGDFDVSKYLDELQYLSVEEGHVLEYVYYLDGMGGFPILYVRKKTSKPFVTFSQWKDASCSTTSCKNYLDDIVIDDTPEGYVQFVTLAIMGDQFYLWWHAAYNDYQLIWDQNKMEEILETLPKAGEDGALDDLFWINEAEAETLRGMDLAPTILYNKANPGIVRVRVVVFTKWGGFIRRTYKIKRNKGSGARIMNIQEKVLVEYSVNYVF
jgi:hypothetical protein